MSITRTTISIDEGLLETAKGIAAQRNLTLGQLITTAVQRQILDETEQSRPGKVHLTTSGHGGLRPGVNLNSNAELSELLDQVKL